MSKRWLVPVGLAAAALIATGCGSSSSSSTGTGSGSGGSGSGSTASNVVKTASIGGATVLTNAKGFTLYWFVPDTSTKSNCNGACAKLWPPVTGPVTAGPGVTGTLGTISRSNGAMQATWDGHPLYTYKGDTGPGQNNGNKIAEWHEVTVSGGAAAPSASPSKSKSSGGGGYGY